MSTPWCWKAVGVNDHEIPEQIVALPAPPEVEEIADMESLMPHVQNVNRICEQIVDIPVPNMTEQLIGGRTEQIVAVPPSGLGRAQ